MVTQLWCNALLQVSGDGDPEAGRGHGSLLPLGPAAVDRQLRSPLRLHLRLPRLLRHHALRHLRRVRAEAEAGPAVDLSTLLCLHLRGTHPAVLCDADTRLWDLQILQLYSHHQGLLLRTEHWSQRDSLTLDITIFLETALVITIKLYKLFLRI